MNCREPKVVSVKRLLYWVGIAALNQEDSNGYREMDGGRWAQDTLLVDWMWDLGQEWPPGFWVDQLPDNCVI